MIDFEFLPSIQAFYDLIMDRIRTVDYKESKVRSWNGKESGQQVCARARVGCAPPVWRARALLTLVGRIACGDMQPASASRTLSSDGVDLSADTTDQPSAPQISLVGFGTQGPFMLKRSVADPLRALCNPCSRCAALRMIGDARTQGRGAHARGPHPRDGVAAVHAKARHGRLFGKDAGPPQPQ